MRAVLFALIASASGFNVPTKQVDKVVGRRAVGALIPALFLAPNAVNADNRPTFKKADREWLGDELAPGCHDAR